LLGCSAAEGGDPHDAQGGAHTLGGAQNGGAAQGGAQNGGAAQGGAAQGGAQSGGAQNGGAQNGGAAQGGASQGGSNSAGGTANGGSGTGGASGGMQASGGYQASGGKNNGGASSGGSNNSGGAKNTGGASGGSNSAGGSKATGGSSSGGSNSTGGNASGGSPGTTKKFVGNITTRDSVDTNGMKFSKYWDQITPENAGKWGSVQSSPGGAFNWNTLDRIYDYTQQNNILFKQHTFVWGAQQPSGTPTLAQVENWIKSFCQRYPNTKLIDVVNEPPPHTTPTYTANLGAGESGTYGWITKAFKLAHQYCPNAILILNDYNNLEYGDQQNHFIDIVNQVKAAGAPINAVGCQAHALKSVSASTLQNSINTMATKTGLPVYITEYDIGDANDTNQANIFKAQFPIFLNTASVHGITVWGWINGATWVANTGLMNNTTPRPAMTWLMQQLGRPVPPN
jgi:endo-1,4-beta-xylanase